VVEQVSYTHHVGGSIPPWPTMKLPQAAKLVFQGKIFSVYQWEQKLYDGTSATFEMLKRTGTIQVIPTADDHIYLSYEEQPTKPRSYTLFGGRQEENEDPLVTAKRELLEETGFESDDWELLKTYENGGKIEWPMYVYVARNCRKVTDQKLDPGEKIEIKKVTFNEFIDITSSETFWGQIFSNDILRMRLNEEKFTEFKKKLFK
jgi:ADP-ribose pyrophosphatase